MTHEIDGLAGVLCEARAIAGVWDGGAERLRACVVRPLAELVSGSGDDDDVRPGAGGLRQRLWALTRSVTVLAAAPRVASQVLEAAAGLQDLVVSTEDDEEVKTGRLAELVALQGGVGAGIRVMTDGPYLVTGARRVTSHLGVPIETRPVMALCRCGASEIKPLCDGSHAGIGFSGEKDPNRVPDLRESHAGTSVTVVDNRGLCAHSGFCTDRLKSVFHVDGDPFVTPSGGRMDEIVAAVRACPSGALSFAVDGREAREQVDLAGRAEEIEVSKDGPYRVVGGIALTDDQGTDLPRPDGASHEHYSLCRCGHSRNKPFCSGMHWYVNFRDPAPPEDPTVFEWAGGLPALLRMTRIFYSKYVPQEPLLAPLFANMSPDHPERVASWLAQVFGGPSFYSDNYGGYHRMLSQHIGKRLTEDQRARWVTLMVQAANDALLPNDAEFRAAFVSYIEWGSRLAVENSQTDAHPPQNMPMPRWWWVCDATPGSRISALAPTITDDEDEPVVLPAEDEPVGFLEHVKGLFRSQDRRSMKFAFDLWSYEDVHQHADAILERLSNETMPCDGAWPPDKLRIFQQWIQQGKAE